MVKVIRKQVLFHTAVIFLFFSFFTLHADASHLPESEFDISGTYRYQLGDDAVWASPDFDDSGWKTIQLPSSFNLFNFYSRSGVIWYRKNFVFPDGMKGDGLYLGRIGDADEVFLNGVKIGNSGSLGKCYVEAQGEYRLYLIPETLIEKNKKNTIAIRVMYTLASGGFYDSAMIIGDHAHLTAVKLMNESRLTVYESSYMTGLVIFLFVCVLLYVRGTREPEYLYFGLFVCTYLLFFFLDSHVFFLTGSKSAFIQRTVFALLSAMPIFLTLFLVHVCGQRVTALIKAVIALMAVVALGSMIFRSVEARKILGLVRAGLFLFTAAYYFYLALTAYREKRHESKIILPGVAGYILGSRISVIGGISQSIFPGLVLIDYAMGFFLACMAYAMVARYARVQQALRRVSEKVLDAHEEERRRVARDIHDGLGQSLLALKLNLQMLHSNLEGQGRITPDDLARLITDVSHAITETRQISLNLKPTFLDNMDFIESLVWQAANYQKRTGIRVSVTSMATKTVTQNITVKMKDNLYRIYQEALNNAAKHSNALDVDVFVEVDDVAVKMTIHDNGKGFEPSEKTKDDPGIGLSSIRERTALLGGRCLIESSPEEGTKITIEVPVNDKSIYR